jgi:hypothetical protein
MGCRYRFRAYDCDSGEHLLDARHRFGVCGDVVGGAVGGVARLAVDFLIVALLLLFVIGYFQKARSIDAK